jgi:hypothetical protein
MSGRPLPRKRVSVHRRLALESLERREVFSLAPTHSVLPATTVEDDASANRLDVSGDHLVTPIDALVVINALNSALVDRHFQVIPANGIRCVRWQWRML